LIISPTDKEEIDKLKKEIIAEKNGTVEQKIKEACITR
jgi:hypothetical protein